MLAIPPVRPSASVGDPSRVLKRIDRSRWLASGTAAVTLARHFPKQFVSSTPCSQQPWLDYLVYPTHGGVEIHSRAIGELQRWCQEGEITFLDKGVELEDNLKIDPAVENSENSSPVTSILAVALSCQIHVTPAVDAVLLGVQIAATFPNSKTLFVFPTKACAEQFAESLRAHGYGTIGHVFGRGRTLDEQLNVGTFDAALRGGFGGMGQIPVCVVPQWPGSFHRNLKRLAIQPDMQRLYLIRDTNDRISDLGEFELKHRIGPCVTGDAKTRARHVVHEIRFGGKGNRSKHGKCPELLDKNKLYWTHRRRNLTIARLAMELARNSSDADSHRPRLAIVVEVTKHLEELAKLLTDLIPITQEGGTIPSMPACSIVTISAITAIESSLPETLIIAMGGPPSPTLGNWIRRSGTRGESARIIDFSDGFNPQAERCARRRQVQFKELGADYRPLDRSLVRKVLQAE